MLVFKQATILHPQKYVLTEMMTGTKDLKALCFQGKDCKILKISKKTQWLKKQDIAGDAAEKF